MKKYIFFLLISILANSFSSHAKEETDFSRTALIIIDIQDFYFPGGIAPLFEPVKAAEKAKVLLHRSRKAGIKVIHVKHNANGGDDIHSLVKPIPHEKVISKDHVNAFLGTDLANYLKENEIEKLILCGMQTHMCLEAATRAASDMGFDCTVAEDACTTRDLKFDDVTIKALDVHYSTLNTLKGNYAKVKTVNEIVKGF